MQTICRATLTALIFAAFAAKATALSIGDPPPALQVGQWLKGEPISEFNPDQTYVILSWSTWCGDPCLRQYPDLSNLARQYADVVFIALNVFDQDKEQTVAAYMKSMGDQMDFRIALDTRDEFMLQNWVKAAGEEGVPSAFIVHHNQLAWIGHPDGLPRMLPHVLADDFDIELAKQHDAMFAQIRAFQQKAKAGATDAELEAEGQELEALYKQYNNCFKGGDSWTFNAQEYVQRARYQAALENFRAALSADADAETLATFEAAVRAADTKDQDSDSDILHEKEEAAHAKKIQEWATLTDAYFAAVRENGEPARTSELTAQIEAFENPEPYEVNCMAWKILTELDPSQRDRPFALRLAKIALDASEEKDAAILDTYARALFDSSRVAEAIEYQQKAIDACAHEWDKPEYAQRLAEYQAASTQTEAPVQ